MGESLPMRMSGRAKKSDFVSKRFHILQSDTCTSSSEAVTAQRLYAVLFEVSGVEIHSRESFTSIKGGLSNNVTVYQTPYLSDGA